MKRHLALLVFSLALLSGFATTTTTAQADVERREAGWILPAEAIARAAAAAPGVVSGTFALKVRATGRDQTQLFLNSEVDYRNPRNVSVALTPRAATHLRERLGGNPQVVLKGKSILVRSAAVRVRIDWYAQGVKTGRFYYQTQIPVLDGDQITVLESTDLTAVSPEAASAQAPDA